MCQHSFGECRKGHIPRCLQRYKLDAPLLAAGVLTHVNLLKSHTGHGLIDKLVIVMFSITDETGMIAKGGHVLQVVLHVAPFAEQLVAKQAVYGKYCRGSGKVGKNFADGIPDSGLIVCQFQQQKNIGIVDLAKTNQRIALDFF